MKILKLTIAVLLVAVAVCDNCSPYGVRLNYGQAFATQKQSPEKLGLRFNTKDACEDVTLKINSQ